ncbi:replication initiation protein [Romboutsia sp. 1001216sp1]|uniref:replication initiation protein n=1 Tax=unclassified Romboutsia TaxID=2626894 RepID=UPI0018A0D417|nr:MULTISPECIES: replication initiation protein [unclassified Romboutsia]MDB8803482.1 replication initiation protein [Romboutsia sp. 1001216sp1]MDB8814852.1 replication initiation protein [Romboutsia sp. 1001216sp1]
MYTNEKNIVMKNNIIIKAKYNISTLENRIFLMLLYKLQKNNDDVIKCEISHEEFKTIIKKKQTSSIDSISNLLVNLRKQSIYFKDDEGWGEYGFINGFKYIKSRKTFKIEASKEIHTYIRNYLEIGYTPINLSIFFGLINPNSQRFYDLLRLWSGTKSIINYRIDELKELLMLEDKYDRYNDFKRRVILPAIKELNETGYFEIDFKENKVGRKVDSIDFILKDLDKRKYFTKDIVEEVPTFEKVAITCDDKVEKIDNVVEVDINKDTDLFIPDEKVFTKGTLRSFRKDFKDIDFKNEYMERAFEDAVMITFDRDDVETIKANSYKFFKGTLDNKIIEYKIEEQRDIEHKNEMEKYW